LFSLLSHISLSRCARYPTPLFSKGGGIFNPF
jgi:hypothetical protein